MIYRNYKGFARKKKKKYSYAEQVAFRMGQEDRVTESIKAGKDSRVYDAYCKGINGYSHNNKKSLFGD